MMISLFPFPLITLISKYFHFQLLFSTFLITQNRPPSLAVSKIPYKIVSDYDMYRLKDAFTFSSLTVTYIIVVSGF